MIESTKFGASRLFQVKVLLEHFFEMANLKHVDGFR